MTDKDRFAERGRSLEDDYFRQRDQELIEKMRSAAAADQGTSAADQARAEMGQKLGITDPDLILDLGTLGFTPDTVVLLPLVPAVQIAWAEGSVTSAERNLIVELARSRGIEAGSAADHMLADWLDVRPGAPVFARATRVIRAMLASPEAHDLTADDLLKQYESIAGASGGILGMNRVSARERQLLAALAGELKAR